MDDLDLTILSELSEDSSISIPRLSEKIKVNPSVVYSRIKRLTKRKLIERFTIIVNDKELG
ncbi:MAG: Lrp/AsnC family transcriptional regulator, partial [Candidatus Nitrosotenuis sp.]